MTTDVRVGLATQNGDGAITIKPPKNKATWVATLSNGETVVENTGSWTIKKGEPLPWTRLCHFLADNDLHVTSLRVNFDGKVVHMPRAKFDKFGHNAKTPNQYSLCYKVEAEMNMDGGVVDQTLFIDLAAHYDDFAVHYVLNTTNGNESWISVTDNEAVALTPRYKED